MYIPFLYKAHKVLDRKKNKVIIFIVFVAGLLSNSSREYLIVIQFITDCYRTKSECVYVEQ